MQQPLEPQVNYFLVGTCAQDWISFTLSKNRKSLISRQCRKLNMTGVHVSESLVRKSLPVNIGVDPDGFLEWLSNIRSTSLQLSRGR